MKPSPSFKVSSNVGGTYEEWLQSTDNTLSLLKTRSHDLVNYRVPSKLRAVRPDAYTPQRVSIGPFHRNKPELQAMEEVKWRYMLCFLDRVAETDTGSIQTNESHGESSKKAPRVLALDKCFNVISDLEIKVREFYAENIILEKQQLVEMLLVDACFILEFMRRRYLAGKVVEEPSYVMLVGRATRPMFNDLMQDLWLLENQIPYYVLQQLFDLIPSSRRISNARGALSLHELAYYLFQCRADILFHYNINPLEKPIQNATFSHLLDMLYQFCSPTSKVSPFTVNNKWGSKRCAAELIKSGFQISLHESKMSMVDIKFSEGEIFIPIFVICPSTTLLLRNLIALEQTRNDRQVISSYMSVLRSLVHTREDVYILEQAGIMKNPLNMSNTEVLFKRLWEEVNSVDFVFRDLCEEINNYKIPVWRWRRVKGYVTITWYRWKESIKDLKRDYFKNRWSFIAFLAASSVILLTIVQTFYTVRAYYPPYH